MNYTEKAIARLSARLGHQPLALVTGGSSGMGASYADVLAKAGCRLLLVSNQDEALKAKAAELTERFGAEVATRYQDLSTPHAALDLLQWCDAQGLEVDILINNAGMFFFQESTPANLGRSEIMLRLHVMTPSRLTVLFGERMKQRGYGYILIISSMAAGLPMPGISFYSATKAYLKSFGRSMYFEMRPYGVGVTVVCPGAIATPLYGLKPSLMNFGVGIGVIKRPQWLVRRAVKAMLRRRRCLSPALMNIYLPPLIGILPKWLVTKLWKRFGQ